jgi:hypothetical protein
MRTSAGANALAGELAAAFVLHSMCKAASFCFVTHTAAVPDDPKVAKAQQ